MIGQAKLPVGPIRPENVDTLFVAVRGPEIVNRAEFEALVRPVIDRFYQGPRRASWQALPIDVVEVPGVEPGIVIVQVAAGPYIGDAARVGDRFISAFKWNLTRQLPVEQTVVLELVTQALFPAFEARGFEPIGFGLQPFGGIIRADRGVPPTPPLPRLGPAVAILAVIGGALMVTAGTLIDRRLHGGTLSGLGVWRRTGGGCFVSGPCAERRFRCDDEFEDPNSGQRVTVLSTPPAHFRMPESVDSIEDLVRDPEIERAEPEPLPF